MTKPITGTTELLAILADPIAAVQTPRLVNERLAMLDRDAVLVPMHVRRGQLAAALAGLRAMQNLRGAVMTMPHKTDVVALLDELTPEARLVGACNVVRREADGRLIGTILDGEGFVAALRDSGVGIAGRRAELLGAGGAASAIAFALAKYGAGHITIRNRTAERAAILAGRVRAAFPSCTTAAEFLYQPDAAPFHDGDLVVNATSLGMRPDDPLPLRPERLRAGVIAAEIVIVPEQTAFVQVAEQHKCQVHRGRPMLLAQVALMTDFMLGLA